MKSVFRLNANFVVVSLQDGDTVTESTYDVDWLMRAPFVTMMHIFRDVIEGEEVVRSLMELRRTIDQTNAMNNPALRGPKITKAKPHVTTRVRNLNDSLEYEKKVDQLLCEVTYVEDVEQIGDPIEDTLRPKRRIEF